MLKMVLSEKKVSEYLRLCEDNIRLIKSCVQCPFSMPYAGFAADLYLSTSYMVDVLWRSLLLQRIDSSHGARIKRLMKMFLCKFNNELLTSTYRASRAYEMYYSQKNVPALELF